MSGILARAWKGKIRYCYLLFAVVAWKGGPVLISILHGVKIPIAFIMKKK